MNNLSSTLNRRSHAMPFIAHYVSGKTAYSTQCSAAQLHAAIDHLAMVQTSEPHTYSYLGVSEIRGTFFWCPYIIRILLFRVLY